MKLFLPAVSSALLLLGACDTVRTSRGRIDTDKTAGHIEGQLYFLPRGQIQLKGQFTDKEQTNFQVTVGVSYVADPRHRYYLDVSRNAFYEDDFKLHTNSKGLLETVNIATEDKTGAIISDLASIASGLMKYGAGGGLREMAPAAPPPPKPQPFDYTFNMDEYHTIKRLIHDRGFDLTITEEQAVGAWATQAGFTRPSNTSLNESAPGIVFRPTTVYRVVVTDEPYQNLIQAFDNYQAAATKASAAKMNLTKLEAPAPPAPQPAQPAAPPVGSASEIASAKEELKNALDQEQTLRSTFTRKSTSLVRKGDGRKIITRVQGTAILPSEKELLLLKLGRTPFVKRTNNIGFADGILSKYEGVRPSPVVGFLQIPKSIVTAIVPLPLELKQIHINNINAQRQLDALERTQP